MCVYHRIFYPYDDEDDDDISSTKLYVVVLIGMRKERITRRCNVRSFLERGRMLRLLRYGCL